MATRYVYKSARTGRFVSKATVKRHPSTTFRQRTRPRRSRGGPIGVLERAVGSGFPEGAP